ncbi:MAG: peptidoglycan-binding domain-containing protein [Candidatus Omnitrophota bacterium]|jgi:peptidoglycan hydrolase-like protein with peptidoglycan-binding domain|nr:peptidoglycan-binding domain-containing protein [Candidatus Omnitrophota bacterium]MDD5518556.1 peptidoglycan-binding domain-containing protein [Candidatus Omnitrophota bacterium]
MFRKAFVLVLLVVFAVSLAGCASMGTVKQKDREIQGLRNQISVLEVEIQDKEQEINGLKDALSFKQVEQARFEEKRPSARDIQNALAKAGFDPGKIDGRLGKKTRQALKAFQKAHNLKVNGKADRRTWAVLSEYLSLKTK